MTTLKFRVSDSYAMSLILKWVYDGQIRVPTIDNTSFATLEQTYRELIRYYALADNLLLSNISNTIIKTTLFIVEYPIWPRSYQALRQLCYSTRPGCGLRKVIGRGLAIRIQFAKDDEDARFWQKLLIRFYELVPEVVEGMRRQAGKSKQEAWWLIGSDWEKGFFNDNPDYALLFCRPRID
jgi:hypothetical protein